MSTGTNRPVQVSTSSRPGGAWANAWSPVWDDQPAPKPARPKSTTDRPHGK